MKKLIAGCILLLITANIGFAQTETEIKAQALIDAKASGDAAVQWIPDQILKYTHPNVANLVGGTEKLKEILEATKVQMDEGGMKIDEYEVLEVTAFLKEQGEYRCLVATKMKMTLPQTKLTNLSHLFGFYNAELRRWTFIEGNQMNGPGKQQLFPELITAIEIPADVVTPE
jgi:hypothetical protein